MSEFFALGAEQFLRSISASRDTLGKPRMKLVEVVSRFRQLTNDAPYAAGGLAQILWACKSHTDDLDLVVSAADLQSAYDQVRAGSAGPSWTVPETGAHESDDVFEVVHLMHQGSVVDVLAFRNTQFNDEILVSAEPIPELGAIRFVRPELLLVTQLLRPGPLAALAAVELVIARRAKGGLDVENARIWAERVQRGPRLQSVLQQADTMSLI